MPCPEVMGTTYPVGGAASCQQSAGKNNYSRNDPHPKAALNRYKDSVIPGQTLFTATLATGGSLKSQKSYGTSHSEEGKQSPPQQQRKRKER